MNTKKILNLIHYLHYLSYPFLLLGMFFVFRKHFVEHFDKWSDMNFSFLFMGIALSFTGLADVKRIGGMTKKVMANPKGGKAFLIYLIILTFAIFGLGFYGLFQTEKEGLKEISVGIIVLGIGVISLIKMSTEIMEHNDHIEY